MFVLLVITCVIFLIGILLLNAPKSKSKTNIWFALFLFSAGLGYPVSMLRYYIIPALNNNKFITIFSQFLSAISFRFSTCFFLLSGISYSDFCNEKLKRKLRYLLFVPAISTFILDLIFPDIGFIKQHIYETKWFLTTAIWGVPYVIIGNILFFQAYYFEQNLKSKKRKLLIFLITLPLLGNALVAFGTPVFKLSGWQMWITSLMPTGLTIIVLVFNLFKIDLMGIRIKIEKISPQEEEKEELLNEANLSKTEIVILEHLLRGLSTKEIADMEMKAQQTVKNQINSIYRKMGVKSKADLIEKLKIKGH
jgi:DNA-binding CsgD family transcriptional regulator